MVPGTEGGQITEVRAGWQKQGVQTCYLHGVEKDGGPLLQEGIFHKIGRG